MIIEVKFVIEVETQVLPNEFQGDNRVPYQGQVDRGIWKIAGSCEIEELSFAVLYYKASVNENFGHNIVATKKKGRR